MSGHHIIAAVGVDAAGDKHLLGLAMGASENAQVVKDLLRGLIERGLDASLSYLFVIDGGAALRSAIDEMFRDRAKVQRCRTHKLRNVLARLPKTEATQTKAVMMAAYDQRKSPMDKLAPKDGMAKMKKQALQWLEREHPDAAASLLEGAARDLHRQCPGPAAHADALPVHDQHHREPQRRRAAREPARHALSRCRHGAALDGRRVPGSTEVVPQDPSRA